MAEGNAFGHPQSHSLEVNKSNALFSQWLSGLDFEYWSTGQHKVEPSVFFEKWAKGEAVLLDVRAPEEKEFVTFPFALEISHQRIAR